MLTQAFSLSGTINGATFGRVVQQTHPFDSAQGRLKNPVGRLSQIVSGALTYASRFAYNAAGRSVAT